MSSQNQKALITFAFKILSFVFPEENEERSMIDPISREDPKVKELIKVDFYFLLQCSLFIYF